TISSGIFQIATADVLRGQLHDAEQGVEAQRITKVMDCTQRGIECFYALIVADRTISRNLLACDQSSASPRKSARVISKLRALQDQVTQQIVGCRDANWQVWSVSDLAEYRRFVQRRVEAETVHADIF